MDTHFSNIVTMDVIVPDFGLGIGADIPVGWLTDLKL